MRNRIIATVLIIALIPCCLAVNASAATKDTFINLMSATNEYTFSAASGSVTSADNYGFATNANNIKISWWLPDVSFVDYIYFTIYSYQLGPSEVIATFDTSSTTLSCEFVGSNGNYYNYRIKCYGGVSLLNLTVKYPWAYSGAVVLYSAFGSIDNSYVLDSGTLINQMQLYYPESDSFYRENFEAIAGFLPLTSTSTSFPAEAVDPLLSGIYYFRPKIDSIPFDYADSVSFYISCSGSFKSDPSLSIISSSGSYVGSVPVEITSSAHFLSPSANFPGDSNFEWPYWAYTVTADISGYNLSDYSLTLQYEVDPVFIETYDGDSGYTSTVRSCVFYPTLEQEPWYARFGKWITGGFNSVVSGLSSGFQSVVDAISSVFNPDGSNELSQAGEDLSQSAGDIDAAGDVLGSVDQPEVNSGDLIGGYTDFDTGGLNILSAMTSNAYVTQMMVVVFTFCLGGYIFFGKKG